jgi:membrane associated rhomboid family serine protease
MVLPLGDDNSDRRIVPYMTWTLIACNVVVFVVFQQLGENDAFTMSFSAVPQEIATGRDIETPPQLIRHPITHELVRVPGLGPTPVPVYFTLLTSMFMHGSVMHLLGNMLYLWIFGDNVEDRMGHGRYLAYYLACGLIASLAHVLTSLGGPAAEVPSLGASGAISGIQGGYLLLFPHKWVRVIVGRFLTEVPAFVAIGLWFLFQIVSSLAAGPSGGGVAYAAHIGGFLAGLALVVPFAWRAPAVIYRDRYGRPWRAE